MVGSDSTTFRTYTKRTEIKERGSGQQGTYFVQSNMGVEKIHRLAESLVGIVGGLHPDRIRMCIPDELRQVNHTTEDIAESVQILDHAQKLVPGLRCL